MLLCIYFSAKLIADLVENLCINYAVTTACCEQ